MNGGGYKVISCRTCCLTLTLMPVLTESGEDAWRRVPDPQTIRLMGGNMQIVSAGSVGYMPLWNQYEQVMKMGAPYNLRLKIPMGKLNVLLAPCGC